MLLPQYYYTKNITSFIRQLNLYGFKKKRNNKRVMEFSHSEFIRGNRDKILSIQKVERVDKNKEIKEELLRTKNEYNQYKEELVKIKEDMDIFKQNNNKLLSLNQQLFDELKCERKESKSDLTKLLWLLFRSFDDSSLKLESILNEFCKDMSHLEPNEIEILQSPIKLKTVIPFLVDKINHNQYLKKKLFNLLGIYDKKLMKKESKQQQLINRFKDKEGGKGGFTYSIHKEKIIEPIRLISLNDNDLKFKLKREFIRENTFSISQSEELYSKYKRKKNTQLSIRSTEQAESEVYLNQQVRDA